MGILLIYAAISICFSFLCSIWEAVLLSITPSFVNTELQKGSSLGKSLDKFKQDIDRPLSAILTLNTIAHTLGAIGVGAAATKVFTDWSPVGGLISWDLIVAVIMTLLILFLSEIIPKTIGANNWKSLAPFTVKSLTFLLKALAPLIWVSQLITKRFKKEKGKGVLTRTDFLALANVGITSGALEESESSIISNLLGMDTLKVQDVMTPRTVMQMKDENITMEEYYNNHKPMRFSRIPIYSGKPDSIIGMVLKDEILTNMVEGNKDHTLASIKREVKMINQDKTLKELFEFLTDENTHLAIVHDNYGSVTGVVTMEDMLETILGMEIVDESDKVADLQLLARKSWEERAKKLGIIN
ncbi:MAG: CBS domain containing-hemolysin-like protein [Saprospiraceae bacterium]|jgi:CBS domain containing-hemolysin-like protein